MCIRLITVTLPKCYRPVPVYTEIIHQKMYFITDASMCSSPSSSHYQTNPFPPLSNRIQITLVTRGLKRSFQELERRSHCTVVIRSVPCHSLCPPGINCEYCLWDLTLQTCSGLYAKEPCYCCDGDRMWTNIMKTKVKEMWEICRKQTSLKAQFVAWWCHLCPAERDRYLWLSWQCLAQPVTVTAMWSTASSGVSIPRSGGIDTPPWMKAFSFISKALIVQCCSSSFHMNRSDVFPLTLFSLLCQPCPALPRPDNPLEEITWDIPVAVVLANSFCMLHSLQPPSASSMDRA